MRRHGAGRKADGAEHETQHDHAVGWAGGGRLRRRLDQRDGRSRDQKPIDRQTDDEVQRGPAQACAAPAECMVEPRRKRPADGAGKSGDQGDAGDRAARLAAIDRGQRGKGRIVKPQRHAEAQHRPCAGERDRPPGEAEPDEPGRQHQVRQHQHAATAAAVDRPADRRPQRRLQQQRGREKAEKQRFRHLQSGGDRLGQDRRQIIARCPGQSLRRPERRDGQRLAAAEMDHCRLASSSFGGSAAENRQATFKRRREGATVGLNNSPHRHRRPCGFLRAKWAVTMRARSRHGYPFKPLRRYRPAKILRRGSLPFSESRNYDRYPSPDDCRRQLSAAGLADRPRAADPSAAGADPRAGIVAGCGALARTGAGRCDGAGDPRHGAGRHRHHHRWRDPSRKLFEPVCDRALRGRHRPPGRGARPVERHRRRAAHRRPDPPFAAGRGARRRIPAAPHRPHDQDHDPRPVHDVAPGQERVLPRRRRAGHGLRRRGQRRAP